MSGGWANPQAEENVRGLLDHIEANYNIDLRKTLLTGYSMGATGTWYLAPRHAERFEAAVPMAGRPPADSAKLNWQTPMYIINSRADELIPFRRVQSTVEQLQTRNAPLELVVVDEITHFQVPRYQPHLRAAIPWIRRVWSK